MRWSSGLSLAVLTAALLGSGALSSTSARAGAATHVVEPGDTLWALAEAQGCTVAQLRAANELEPEDALVVGKELKLPSCGGVPAPEPVLEHVVVEGDSLDKIAAHYGTSIASLRERNGLDGDVIRVGQRLRLPNDAGASTVRAGQSRGKVNDGWLEAPTQLPHSAAYYRRRLPRTYASEHLIAHTVRVVEGVRKHRPGVHRLAIGDLSAPEGGPLSGHRTHQSGRDIDLGFYFVKPPANYPDEFVPGTRENLNVDATWELLEGFVRTAKQPSGVALVYLDYDIQRLLYPAARRDGWSPEQLAEVFEYPDGRGASGRVVRHLWNHHDHLHVRFRCPPADAGCR